MLLTEAEIENILHCATANDSNLEESDETMVNVASQVEEDGQMAIVKVLAAASSRQQKKIMRLREENAEQAREIIHFRKEAERGEAMKQDLLDA